MKYQDCAEPTQAADEAADEAQRLCIAKINPRTGLATDYRNHFNEALEMLSACPDCIEDLMALQPLSYRQHFAASRFKSRDLAITAYKAPPPAARECLDALAGTMTAVLEATRAALRADMPVETAALVAARGRLSQAADRARRSRNQRQGRRRRACGIAGGGRR